MTMEGQGFAQIDHRKCRNSIPLAVGVVIETSVIAKQIFLPAKERPRPVQVLFFTGTVRQCHQPVDSVRASPVYMLAGRTEDTAVQLQIIHLPDLKPQKRIPPLFQQFQIVHFCSHF